MPDAVPAAQMEMRRAARVGELATSATGLMAGAPSAGRGIGIWRRSNGQRSAGTRSAGLFGRSRSSHQARSPSASPDPLRDRLEGAGRSRGGDR
jgi:hypothetical protein